MEKLEEKVGRFLSSLTQYLQQLCHESVDFDKFAVVTGHLFLTLDNDKDIEFNVNETVYKTENNVIEYMSNSHHLPPLQVQHDLLLPVKEEKSVSSLEFTSLNKPGKGQPKKKGVRGRKKNLKVKVQDSGNTEISDTEVQELIHQSDEEFFKLVLAKPKLPKQSKPKVYKPKHIHNCLLCGRNFPSPSKMKGHLKRHTGERPFTCETCGKNFPSDLRLKSHMIVHTELKPYMCDVCGQAYKQPQSLVLHRRRHTGEKPHICPVCGVAFAQLSSLVYHKTSHLVKREFQCDVCPAAFKSLRHLKRHKKTHTDEKNIKCEVCGKRFLNKEYLKKHSKHHLSEKPHICDICGDRFARRDYLTSHRRRHTNEKPKPKPYRGDSLLLIDQTYMSMQDGYRVPTNIFGQIPRPKSPPRFPDFL